MPGRVGQLFSLNIFFFFFYCILYLIRIYLCDIKKKNCLCVCDIPSIQISKKLKVKNLISQNIRTFPKINKKKDLLNRKVIQSMIIYALNTWPGLL